jgi:phosphoserine aminotransferase
MSRVYNFAPGPGALPEEVLKKAGEEIFEYRGSGMSVMEMSHRSKEFEAILNNAAGTLRELMGIPENYHILFLQGGASTQFAMVPLNLFSGSRRADYVETGSWAKKAIEEARKYGTVNVVASSKDRNFSYIPRVTKSSLSADADYVHITTNNTIYGTRFSELPDTGNVPLVADMSSNILSEACDVSKFGLIYAGAQKNLGPAGLTVVIVRKDLVGKAMSVAPTMLDYRIHADNNSLYNTPPCWCVYIAGLVFEWVKRQGGVHAMEKINREKASLLYGFIDGSKLYKGTAEKKDRSLMNLTFVLPTEDLNAKFVKEAAGQGLVQLKGHRSVGGMRASLYNAVPLEGVRRLVGFMKKFEAENA